MVLIQTFPRMSEILWMPGKGIYEGSRAALRHASERMWARDDAAQKPTSAAPIGEDRRGLVKANQAKSRYIEGAFDKIRSRLNEKLGLPNSELTELLNGYKSTILDKTVRCSKL